MLKRAFICAAMFATAGVQSARANTPCQAIDNVLYSLSLVQSMHSEPGTEYHADTVARLRSVTAQVSMADLLTTDSLSTFPDESALLSDYLGRVQEAVSGDDSIKAASSIKKNDLQGVAGSIQSLTTFWNCHPKDTSPPNSEALPKVTSFTEAAVGDYDSAPDGEISGSSEKSNSRNPAINNVVLDRGGRNISAVMEDYSRMFYITMFILIVALTYFLHRRSKRFKSRESRRIIHKPATARIRKADHDIIIVDISMNGLKIRHPDMLQSQRKLRLKIDGTWYFARIMWSNKMFAGIRFKKPINSETFHSIVQ